MKTIIIAGHGKLANSINNNLTNHIENCEIDFWENVEKYQTETMIIIHIGSGRQLPDIIKFCEETGVPLIQASTGISEKRTEYSFTFIDAPNLSLLMLKFMYMLKENGDFFKEYGITIAESHQSTKKTAPGTAIEMANALGINPSEIKSIRQPEEQKTICGINEENLALHAFHDITIQDEGTRIQFKTLVEGHSSYVKGLAKIINSIPNLKPQYYHILDLVEMRMV
ncbi:MAG: hypothetical protein JXR63_09335 [Spirochaetales bacterium]|nr:hypothetical protein [Spirochaetales bacterium]